MKRKYIKKISDLSVAGGLGVMVLLALNGCEQNKNTNALNSVSDAKTKGAFVILQEEKDGSYKILEEYPSTETRVVVKDQNGNERILSQEEIDKLIKAEELKINNGTSELTNQNPSSSSGGLGLGGAILASAAGAILGSYIGNRLFNNPTYQQNQMRNYKSPQAYQRSQSSFSNATRSGSKSGFFGSNSSNRAIGG